MYCARILHLLVRAYIADRTVLPHNPYGNWKTSMLCDQDLANDIMLHLQELGEGITAAKLAAYLSRPEVKAKHGISKTVSERYRYRFKASGQYEDGHERKDVVWYRAKIYIPAIKSLLPRTVEYNKAGDEVHPQTREFAENRQVILWYHDESIFYAHDQLHPKPLPKGEGASLMVADFVSAPFGWLRSPDGLASAHRIFHPGVNRDGYFNNEDILQQAQDAADIVTTHYPDYEHVFIYDNATTHRKRTDDALSALHMPKFMSKTAEENWCVERTVIHPETGRPQRRPDGKVQKEHIRMADTVNPKTGERQSLYYPDDHPTAPGRFKGMGQILIEHGYPAEDFIYLRKGKKAQCGKDLKCEDTSVTANCCTRRILYNQPDFTNVPSLLESAMKAHGIRVLFLRKFHCELNPIEQCWGYAKQVYRLNPESSREDMLIENVKNALESIPLVTIRRYFNHAHRFGDAYERGLNGQQSAWACRKYRGHRVLPERILEDLEKAGLKM
ncbi:hypothetical protein AURDEDRAFT_138271 [Auricularia subglabra TFB-10046 SS5]|nr:hypothetical protein AURDEDRAFT_138271 [Auricularia subglabra TFB-10046 SS5]